jgi:hypothetical protein
MPCAAERVCVVKEVQIVCSLPCSIENTDSLWPSNAYMTETSWSVPQSRQGLDGGSVIQSLQDAAHVAALAQQQAV